MVSAGRFSLPEVPAGAAGFRNLEQMPNPIFRTTRLAALMALVLATSCYKYIPIEGGPSATGREVTLELSERGSIELAPRLGAQLKSVAGRVTEFTDGAYVISMTQTMSKSGLETLWRGETASISSGFVTGVGDRRLDKRRTWIVSVLAVLGVAIAGEAFGVGSGLDGLLGQGGRGPRQ